MTHAKSLFLMICVATAAPMTHATSFDCAKAVSAIERLICSDPVLSELDDSTAAAYTRAVAESAAPDDVKRDQRRWLTKRNRCVNAGCVHAAYRTRLAELSPAPFLGTWEFANSGFGTFTFTASTFTWGACQRRNYRVLREDGDRYSIEVDAAKTCLSSGAKGMYLYLMLDAGRSGMWFRDCPSEQDLFKVQAGSGDNYCSELRAGKQ